MTNNRDRLISKTRLIACTRGCRCRTDAWARFLVDTMRRGRFDLARSEAASHALRLTTSCDASCD